MRPENISDPTIVEQIIVSRSVVRHAEHLPKELVEQHREILASMGLMAELVANLPLDYLFSLLDEVTERKFGIK